MAANKTKPHHQSYPNTVNAIPATQNKYKIKVDFIKNYIYNIKQYFFLILSTTSATQTAATLTAASGTQTRYQSQSSAVSAMPTTQNKKSIDPVSTICTR